MRYLLDTNVCVVFLNGRSIAVRDRLLATPLNEMSVCSVVKAELFYGVMRSNNPAGTLKRQKEFLKQLISLPFGDKAANVFGRIRAHLANVGTPIGAYDLQIASIAMANNLILVTHNVKEFSRIETLKYEDWEV